MQKNTITLQNPYNSEPLNQFQYIDNIAIEEAIAHAHNTFLRYKKTSLSQRKVMLICLSELLLKEKDTLAKSMTQEMGKPITQAIAEIEKCAWLCQHYAEHSESYLKSKVIQTEAQLSEVRYEASGIILAIMPWNYPFWQVLRCVAPALMLGNPVLLKHADNVLQSAQLIEKLIHKAGFPVHIFQHLIIKESQTESIIAHPYISGVSLTGSTKAGRAVASLAGKYIKISVLELGGSNALLVLEDAEITKTVDACIQARFQNNGQSCIAGKRLLIHKTIYKEFVEALIQKVSQLNIGDPMQIDTYISVMAREDLAENLAIQLKKSVEMGAKISYGGSRKFTFFEPTLVENVTAEMPLFKEETFGPVLAISSFNDIKEGIQLANHPSYGLGVSIFTKNIENAKTLIPEFKDGAVFVNSIVKSHPELPFGGSKNSGYGRELGKEGILEFANTKTIYIA